MQTNKELNEVIREYIEYLPKHSFGNDSYSRVELKKLSIADVLLRQLGLPLSPQGGTPQRDIRDQHRAAKVLKPGFVYLVYNKRNGYTKIGWSSKPSLREKTLQSEEPELDMIMVMPGTMVDERLLQLRFNEKRVRGEWFDLDIQDIATIKAENT